MRARLWNIIAFVESVQEDQHARAPSRGLVSPGALLARVLQAQGYLLQVSIPNVYFHAMAAYAIVRHNGVDLGKMDFLSPINWIDP